MSLIKFFKNYNPVIIDIETSGFFPKDNTILEIALITLKEINKIFKIDKKVSYHIKTNRNKKLNFVNINFIKNQPFHGLNFNISEYNLFMNMFDFLKNEIAEKKKKKNILIGHNIYFDLSFLKEIMFFYKIKNEIIHDFIFFDTTTLGLIIYNETVLIKVLKKAKINTEGSKTHFALYDAIKTTELFCKIINNNTIK